MDRQGEILRLHRELDRTSRDPAAGAFISGWRTRHPFAAQYLAENGPGSASVQEYTFLSDSSSLTDRIRRFHRERDGIDYPAEAVFATSGSSPLLISFFLRLREHGVTEAWYVPPIYYACYYFARSLGITLHRMDVPPLHDPAASLCLPAGRSVLLLSDPVWVLGAPVHPVHHAAIAAWQRSTGSSVLVDGTFQYTAWDPIDRPEGSAQLDPQHTFRIVCPTKSMGVHGVRFAYMLMPPEERESIRYPAANLTGATGVHAEDHAIRLMDVLNGPRSNRDLREHISKVHRTMRDSGMLLAEATTPSVSYYTFARLDERYAKDALLMDQRYFDLEGYDGYVRVNLLHGEPATRGQSMS